MTETWPGWKKNAAFLCRHYPRQGPALPDLPPLELPRPGEEPSCKCPPAFWMNSQPAWWKSGRWNNPALLSRVVSGKRRFSIFSRRTGKTRRGVSEGFFSHPFAFLLPTLIRRYFRLSRRTEFPDNPGHIPKTVDTAALTASFRFYRCGSSPPYPAKPIPTSVFCFSKRLLGSIPNPLFIPAGLQN